MGETAGRARAGLGEQLVGAQEGVVGPGSGFWGQSEARDEEAPR